jgi:hypothetical protein
MTDEKLLSELTALRDQMIAVATGGPRIADVNENFQSRYARIASELARRRIENPLPYGDLWDWYGRWRTGDLPTYQSRRMYLADLFSPLINRIRTGRPDDFAPTGWPRVDRTVDEIRQRLATAAMEEQYQAVGLLCREVLISTAQAVHEPARHPPVDGKTPSATDAKRMLEAYVAAELSGQGNEESRKHVRSALDLALALQHRRTAGFRDAAMCVEATTAVVNIIAIVSGRRHPQ